MATTSAIIKKKQAQLRAAAKKAVKEQREKAQIAIMNAKIEKLNNEAFINNRVSLQLQEDAMDKLKSFELQCETIVTDMPIHSAKTKENRKWNPSRQYGMGSQMDILTGLLSGIQYSATAHKSQMLAVTGLPDILIENTLNALGNTAYYSRNYSTVVDEQDYNVADLRANLELIGDILDIQLDFSKVTEPVLQHRFEAARIRAEKDSLEDIATMEMSSQALIV